MKNLISFEGAAEEAILDILLDNDMLEISRDSLIQNGPLEVRSGDEICSYLQKDFDGTITVYRVLDSRNEKFKLNRKNQELYGHKIKVINVVTKPEIEILYILSQDKYQDYLKVKSTIKPSAFCKGTLRCPKIKEYKFVYKYFQDTALLLHTLKEFDRITRKDKGVYSLYDLLKEEYKK